MLTHWSQLVPNNYVNHRHPRTLSNTTAATEVYGQNFVRKKPVGHTDKSELRSCVKVAMAVLDSLSLTVCMVSVDVNNIELN